MQMQGSGLYAVCSYRAPERETLVCYLPASCLSASPILLPEDDLR